MSTVIGVTSKDLLLPAPDQHTPAGLVLPAPDQQPLDQALSTAWAALEAVGHLVVLVPAGLPDEHRRRLHAIRSLLETDRMALVEVDLPPLALALLAQQLRQISRYDLGPGVLASAARLLAHYLHAGAVLSSVTGLDRLEVGLGPHLRSWLPGARFAVLAAPTATLTTLGPHTRLPGPDYPTHLALAAHGLADEWVRSRLGPEWNCGHVREFALPQDSARWWGTARLVEFAAYIEDVGVLYQLVTSAHRAHCRCCGLELVGDRCAFCACPATEPAEHGAVP
ncbi:hypothetical protein ABZ832_03520 [Streptantibioticus parmotrematis]|uniref:hypothetical protein n=1 Tax=Streptantibioticus parmotrematis TaxID=2873249 RepID=UPI0033E49CEE